MKAFISYSHRDRDALDRLHTHLAVLRSDGRLDEWFDREILAGSEIDAEIQERLESSELFLLLVSPDFLASDYCVKREMERALERHHSEDARVVPIIVEPCDWASTALRDIKALPRDGKPVSEWTNENSAFLDVVQELRRMLDAEREPRNAAKGEAMAKAPSVQAGTRRYRVKRDFDEIHRGDFREEAFGVMRDHFERAVAEIDAMEDLRGRFTSLSASSFSCTIVNRAREHGTAHITVHRCTGNAGIGDISHSFTENAPPGTANGWFTIEADEYELHLSGMMGLGEQRERLTPEAAAELLWKEFLEQAGVTSD